jgi:hypothetical protein
VVLKKREVPEALSVSDAGSAGRKGRANANIIIFDLAISL